MHYVYPCMYAGKGHAQPPSININREGPTHNSVHSFFAVDALDGYRESSVTVSLDYKIIAETLQAVTVLHPITMAMDSIIGVINLMQGE